jgi:hypothetical protein
MSKLNIHPHNNSTVMSGCNISDYIFRPNPKAKACLVLGKVLAEVNLSNHGSKSGSFGTIEHKCVDLSTLLIKVAKQF